MWGWLREVLRRWLLHGYEAAVKAPPAGPDEPSAIKMKDAGNGNLQANRVDGDLHHSHTQAVYNIFMMNSESAPQAANSEPEVERAKMQSPVLVPRDQANKPQSQQHSAALSRLDQLQYRSRITVLDFMDREFGTRMVIELQIEQLYRLNKYLDVVLNNPRALKRKKVA